MQPTVVEACDGIDLLRLWAKKQEQEQTSKVFMCGCFIAVVVVFVCCCCCCLDFFLKNTTGLIYFIAIYLLLDMEPTLKCGLYTQWDSIEDN